jgi:hypothetical protein
VSEKIEIDRVTAIRIAGLVPCDPRTVEKFFAGGKTSIVAQQAIRHALRTLGLADPRPVSAPARAGA